MIEFDTAFKALTGNPPFPWQQALYERFAASDIPASCNLPTGLGKTSVIAVWLIALANNAAVPRRLVYVVNRRTVVDQTTDEVEKYRDRLHLCEELAEGLLAINSPPPTIPFRPQPLALSTLRGQFADNREWSADPSRPAVICGTVDMIGSRLLFSGYGIGMKAKPLHAGFLGQDSLLVHDEAHLEPAFQELLLSIEKEQKRCKDFHPLRVMALTATPRSEGEVFELTNAEREIPPDWEKRPKEPIRYVWQRLKSKKALAFQSAKRDAVAKTIGETARSKWAKSEKAVLVFVRTIDDVKTVCAALTDKKNGGLEADHVQMLTGTLRGLERDRLATTDDVFARFTPEPKVTPKEGAVFLVCTSAGEVGVDISADHMVCDLTTLDSMAQRFGRVNRRGEGAAEIDVVYETDPDAKKADDGFELARWKSKEVLERLPKNERHDASPSALGVVMKALTKQERDAAFAPTPVILPATDILFDAWALTTITDKLPGRPPVEPYLHGITDDTFETEFAWREEVAELTGKVEDDAIAELLDEFPLKPHETLKVPTFHKRNGAYLHLEVIRERSPNLPAWVIDPNGEVTVYSTLTELLKTTGKDEYAVRLAERTVILPPKAGGLTANGTLDGSAAFNADKDNHDVAGTPPEKVTPLFRLLITPGEEGETVNPVGEVRAWPKGAEIKRIGRTFRIAGKPHRTIYTLDIPDPNNEEAPPKQYVVVKPIQSRTGETPAAEWPALDAHLTGVGKFAAGIVKGLQLDPKLAKAVTLAAEWHDHGKARTVWQRGAGNSTKFTPVAKTLHGRPPENLNHFRHELGSMVNVSTREDLAEQFDKLDAEYKEVVLHLIATHHGRGRPHFPPEESHDIDRPAEVVSAIATDTPGRFARLQRRFGRWGLAYLESLLRAADVLESQRIEQAPIPESKEWPPAVPITTPALRPLASKALPTPSITVAVDPTNPGQFFACCGLLELADRLWPGAEGWFSVNGREFKIACDGGTLAELLKRLTAAEVNSSLSDAELKRLGTLQSLEKSKLTAETTAEKESLRNRWRAERLHLSQPFDLWLDWWRDSSGERTDLKTWAAKVQVLGMARTFHKLLSAPVWSEHPTPDCLTQSVRADVVPFYFDSHAGAQGSARDAGFSTYDLRTVLTGSAPVRPLIELGAFFAFQRFRPCPVEGTDLYRFCTWREPLRVSVASVVAAGVAEIPGTKRYLFGLFSRTQYMKTFLPALPQSGESR